MKSHKPERELDLTPTQVTGSALAAMSGAFFASWAGTTGTIIGAALGSVIVTVGAATYTWSLQRTRDAVRRTAAQVRQQALTANAQPQRVADGPLREPETPEPADTSAYGFLYAAPATSKATPALASQPTVTARRRRRLDLAGLPWPRLLLASAAVTVATLLGITAIEAVAGRPVSSFTGGDSTGTTLGSTFGGSAAGTDDATDTATSGGSGSSDSASDDRGTETDTGSGAGDADTGTSREDAGTDTDPEAPQPTPAPTPAPVDPDTPSPDPEPSTAP